MQRKPIVTLPQLILIIAATILTTTITVLAATGTTDAANAPGLTSSYTLEDIYQRLTNGTAGTQSAFTEPAVAPGTGSMHDLNDIMAAAPETVSTNGATTNQVLDGQSFWGLTNGQWGLQTGTIPSGSNVTGSDGRRTVNIPNGYYSGKTATAYDSDLLANNIAEGVGIFGVTGTLNRRFIDNDDATVTDTFTDIMWTQNANGPDQALIYSEASNYCDTLNLAGYTDWSLPTQEQLLGLTHGEINVLSSTPHNFTHVQSASYWTTTEKAPGFMYIISMVNGDIFTTGTMNHTYTLCMRN